MAGKSKVLPYVIFGVPLLIGGYFLYKAIRNKMNKKKEEEATPTTPTKGGSGSGSGSSDNSDVLTAKLPFQKGSKGYYVGRIQAKLKDLNFTDDSGKDIVADKDFGSKTSQAVIKFQKSKGLKVDGIVGKDTWRALFGVDFPNTGATGVKTLDNSVIPPSLDDFINPNPRLPKPTIVPTPTNWLIK